DDPRFRTNADRLAHVDEVDAIVGAFIGARSLAENLAFFGAAEVTVGPVYDASGFETDPHVQGRGVLVEMEDAELGSIPMHAVIPRLSGTPGVLRRPAPALGQDEEAILASLRTS
ncbi:MAG TPA: CoA transferase, partial [Telluria sp.]